MELNWR